MVLNTTKSTIKLVLAARGSVRATCQATRQGVRVGGSRCRCSGSSLAPSPVPRPQQQLSRCHAVAAGRAAPEPGAPPNAVVTFKACKGVRFGQVLKVVGGLPQLGDWDADEAPAMEWGEGDQWLLTLVLPQGCHEFKVVVACGGQPVVWEPGPNRMLQVPAAAAAAAAAFTVVCEWGQTSASLETVPEGALKEQAEEEADLGAGTESDEPALLPEDLTAEPYSPNGDEDEKPVSMVAKMTVEGTPRKEPATKEPPQVPTGATPAPGAATAAAAAAAEAGGGAAGPVGKKGGKDGSPAAAVGKKPGKGGGGFGKKNQSGGGSGGGDAAAAAGGAPGGGAAATDKHAPVPMEAGDYHSQTSIGKGADAELGSEPAGSLEPATEAAVKKQLQQEAAPKPGFFARFVQALTGSQDKDDDDEGEGGGSSAGSARTGGGTPTPGTAAGECGSGGDPPAGMQLAIGAAGLAALPTVAWSEWVLKSTGCGLPPGPRGLLGAAEGLSYLVVGGVVLWSLARKMGSGSGLPAVPTGMLGAVEGGSWLAALSGLVVLGLQWQIYGYMPSPLPDSNCFGQQEASPTGYITARIPGGSSLAGAAVSQHAAPAVAAINSDKAARAYRGALRLSGAHSLSVPQGNLLFSTEAALSRSGAFVEAVVTAAAAVTAAAGGQPPPAQVTAAVYHVQHRTMQVQQLASAMRHHLVALGGMSGTDQALAATAAAAAEGRQHRAAAPDPLDFDPPRNRVRAALRASWKAVTQSDKVRAVLEPVPLPAVVARQATTAANGALEAVRPLEQAPPPTPSMVTAAPSKPAPPSPAAAAAATRGGKPAVAEKEQAPPGAQPVTPGMFASAVSDLGEGFVGLWESAKGFNPAEAAVALQERMHQQQAPAAAPAPAPASSQPVRNS